MKLSAESNPSKAISLTTSKPKRKGMATRKEIFDENAHWRREFQDCLRELDVLSSELRRHGEDVKRRMEFLDNVFRAIKGHLWVVCHKYDAFTTAMWEATLKPNVPKRSKD